jgi:hypothetical protein
MDGGGRDCTQQQLVGCQVAGGLQNVSCVHLNKKCMSFYKKDCRRFVCSFSHAVVAKTFKETLEIKLKQVQDRTYSLMHL